MILYFSYYFQALQIQERYNATLSVKNITQKMLHLYHNVILIRHCLIYNNLKLLYK